MRVWLANLGLRHIIMLTETEEKREESEELKVSFNLSLANSLYSDQKRGARTVRGQSLAFWIYPSAVLLGIFFFI